MKQEIYINASALKQATCFLRFYRIVIQGYKEPVNSNDIEFGSAFHLFTKSMAETKGDLVKSLAEARTYFKDTPMIVKPKKKYLDDMKLCSVCIEYWTQFQKTDTFNILTFEGKPAVEITFKNKFYEDDKYIIYLVGTIDKIGKFDSGCYAIGDYKTTSSWDIDEYFKSHELGCQLRFYLFNLLLKAKLEPDTELAKICNRPIGTFIDGIFLKSSDSTEFKRSRIFFFDENDMKEFEDLLNSFITKLVSFLNSGIQTPSRDGILLGACAGGYKLCNFYAVCAAPDDNARKHILRNGFKQEPYRPVKEID